MKKILLLFGVLCLIKTISAQEVNFENMVAQQGKLQYLTTMYTNGQGHCAFTPEEVGKAFDDLRAWVKTGKKAKAGMID